MKKYIAIWGDGVIFETDDYIKFRDYMIMCTADEECRALSLRTFLVEDNTITELD